MGRWGIGRAAGRRGSRFAAVVAVVVLAVVVPERPASAHGQLATSVPADGAVVTSPVAKVFLTFTEKPATFAYFAVTAPSGVRVDDPWTNAEPFRLERPVVEYQKVGDQWQPRNLDTGFPVSVPVTHLPERGSYVVSYHSRASDGDVVKGEIRFVYEGSVTVAPPGWRAPTAGPSAELLATGMPQASAAAAPVEAAAPAQDRGPWPWLVPVLLVVAVAGAVALAMTGRSGRARRPRRR